MRPSLIVAGQSHAIALGVPPAAGAAVTRLSPIAHDEADIVGVAGSWPRDDTYWQLLEDGCAERMPAVVWDGNQHQSHFLFEQKPALDFVLSFAPNWPVDCEAQLVPESQLRAFFAPTIAPLEALLARLRAHTAGPIFVLGTPPPKGDAIEMRARVDVDAILLKWASAIGPDPYKVKLTPLPVMLKLWMLVQDMTAKAAFAVGGTFVPVPARAKNAGGFLARDYWSTDVTHANAGFGRIMIEELVDAAKALTHIARPEVV